MAVIVQTYILSFSNLSCKEIIKFRRSVEVFLETEHSLILDAVTYLTIRVQKVPKLSCPDRADIHAGRSRLLIPARLKPFFPAFINPFNAEVALGHGPLLKGIDLLAYEFELSKTLSGKILNLIILIGGSLLVWAGDQTVAAPDATLGA